MMNEWIDELSDLTAAGEPVVVVTVAGIRGSAPREIGAKMIVATTETLGTIGGGQLEYQCTRLACGMLGGDENPELRKFPLGSSMGQCCGGVVDVLFEPIKSVSLGWLRDLRALHGQREPAVVCTNLAVAQEKCVVTADNVFHAANAGEFTAVIQSARDMIAAHRIAERSGNWFLELVVGSDFNIAVFGAGHVGSAVVRSLSALDCNIRWIDSRRNIFRKTPPNVRAIETGEPALEVAAMPPDSCYLVMTHSHALDFAICDRILRRPDTTYCGLIGSVSKRRRFEKRYREQGMAPDAIGRLICPIGVDGISGKKPAEIAVAAAAEVLRAYEKVRHTGDIEYAANVRPIKQK